MENVIEKIKTGEESEKIAGIISLCDKTPVYEDLIEFLKDGTGELVQFALLHLKEVKSVQDTELICSFLADNPSEIREYTSFLIDKLIRNEKFRGYFSEINIEIFEKALCDVNPKVCRRILEIIPYLEEKIKEELFERIIASSLDLLKVLSSKNIRKPREYRKQEFHLYWNLFSMAIFLKEIALSEEQIQKIIGIIRTTMIFKEYTIREKSALLFISLQLRVKENSEFSAISAHFEDDENFYVRNVIISSN